MTALMTELLGARVRVQQARPVQAGEFVTVDPVTGVAVVRVPDCGTFTVSADGRDVSVELVPGTSLDYARGWLYGTVASLVLANQGRFALHASVVALPRGAVAIAGESRAGKSTTSLLLRQRGHPLITDDVSPLETVEDQVWVAPTGRPVHVWPATATALGLDVSAARECWPGIEKLSLPAPEAERMTVSLIVVLMPSEHVDREARRLPPGEAVIALVAQAYRSPILVQHWPGPLMRWAADVASMLPVFTLARSSLGWTANEVASTVEELVAQVAVV